MRKAFGQSISVLLATLMVFATTPVFALAATTPATEQKTALVVQEADVAKTNEAITKFTDAMSKLFSDTEKLNGLNTFLTRFGGVNAAASGVIGVLQMCGIVKDPTEAALNKILDTVKDVQTQLNQIDNKLDDINKQLVGIAVAQEEKDRNNKATSMLKYWRDFKTNYSEPLDDKIAEYQGLINGGIRDWWQAGSHDGIRALYTNTQNGNVLTYAKTTYGIEIPAKADNGEAINRSACIGVPAALLPDTSSMTFSIDKYRDDYETKLAANIIAAANAQGQLDVDQSFYAEWNALTDAQKQEKAKQYAADLLNTQIYSIACDVMSKNDQFVIQVTNAYKKYCDNVLTRDSGVNAMLNAMYLTHGFEGEVANDIKDFCDSMTAKAGVYGQFALTCASQDNMQSEANRLAVQQLFVNTVTSLGNRASKALTGYDNYCYITGTKVSQATVRADAKVHLKLGSSSFKGYVDDGWKVEVPNILNNVYSQVLYHQFKTLNQGQSTFAAYLHQYGAYNSDNGTTTLMTRYGGAKDFAFSEGIRMRAQKDFPGCNYFKSDNYYKIDVGTGSKVEQKYYRVHDKIVYDIFDMNTGEIKVNQTAFARALYGEGHWYWSTDEVWEFQTVNGPWPGLIDPGYSHAFHSWVDLTTLKLEPVHDLNGDMGYDDIENPFFAFDQVTLTKGVSDWIGPTVQTTGSPITAATLKAETFSYTGKPIKPSVEVKSGTKKVPTGSLDISYEECTDVGTASVTVTAKKGSGYIGSAHLNYRIIPKGTKISKVTRAKTSATIAWKAQTEKMGGKRIQGYQIRYSTKKSMAGAKTVKVAGVKKTSAKIKGLKKNKKYYVQIRTYMKVNKQLCYSKWSGKKVVKKGIS